MPDRNQILGLLSASSIALIKIYQVAISPFLGTRCRFYPSCSRYAVESFEKYPFQHAIKMTVARLSRCHPFHPGGVDLP